MNRLARQKCQSRGVQENLQDFGPTSCSQIQTEPVRFRFVPTLNQRAQGLTQCSGLNLSDYRFPPGLGTFDRYICNSEPQSSHLWNGGLEESLNGMTVVKTY